MLAAAIALPTRSGVDALSMRRLAQELGVVPMALYKHVANKDELLDGMVDVVVGEIDPPAGGALEAAMRQRVLSARGPPAPPVGVPGPRVAHQPDAGRARLHGLDDRDLPGRRLLDRPHPPRHARHGQPAARVHPGAVRRLGRRRPGAAAVTLRELAGTFPHITELVVAISHDQASVVGPGCDDQFEFEFALDLMLDGLERLRDRA